ncbi:exonuclease domain-containing protein [Pseudoalteromonas sp. T1lg75]|uniref:exonuclease domain-containing protein n=1 Tax=Pseudoalteromonas sp. T1lg75 TaxID=2077102 RepID=UPI000CF6A667|nr:exonuclease domain-containing protein [Pseudoalteromonas sp. T1lg75]
MDKKVLPPRYYLAHFKEFLHYHQQHAWHLCADAERGYINEFLSLPEHAQCVLVRMYNRKSDFVEQSSLNYEEIDHVPLALALLKRRQWVRYVQEHEFAAWLESLTKLELVNLCKELELPGIALSAKKPMWLAYCQQTLSFGHVRHSQLFLSYLVHSYNSVLHYLLFVFFGRINSSMTQFSLRDLGIRRTNKGETGARFNELDEAKSAFFFGDVRAQAKTLEEEPHLLALAQTLTQAPQPHGALAQRYRHEALYVLGKKLLALGERYEQGGLDLLAESEHPQAVELVVRQRYKRGDKDWAEARLLALIEDPSCEQVLFFAQDFYALKFQGKRTSTLTDLLRDGEPLAIDEAYSHHVEQGVIDLYRQQGIQALHCENQLWLHLFALCFWDALFVGAEGGVCTEFDVFPSSLRDGRFYQLHGDTIAALFTACDTKSKLVHHITANATRHYQQPNAFIRWHENLLDPLLSLIEHAPLSAIYAQLTVMAKDFVNAKDGYPDLMVLAQDKLRFEEIKAPGDSLRRNQLIAIRQLQRAGFEVRVRSVCWQVNPEQPYVVVDIETTGGQKNAHRVTEIAAVKLVNGQEVARWHSLINPERHIPRHIAELTGIDNAMVAEAPTFAQIAPSLWQFLQGAIFVAHNVNFDYGFLRAEFARTDRNLILPKLCTVRLARKHLPGYASYSLGKLCKELGIDLQGHHRAINDTLATVQLFELIQEQRQK